MSELTRLLDASDLDQSEPELARLLRAARAEEPKAGSLPALASALGVSATLASTLTPLAASKGALASVAKTASVGSALARGLALVGKAFAIGAGGGLVVVAALPQIVSPPSTPAAPALVAARELATHPREASQRARAASASSPALAVAAPLEAATKPPRSSDVARPVVAKASAPAVVEVPPLAGATAPAAAAAFALPLTSTPAPLAPPPALTPAETPRVPLAREVALLDRARASLSAGQPADAIAWIAQYEQLPRSGTLEREAWLLKIRALAGAGRRGEAHELAERLVRVYPDSREVAIVKSLIAAP